MHDLAKVHELHGLVASRVKIMAMPDRLEISIKSAAAKQTYKYEALQHADSVRLLELHPETANSPLSCTIIEARLNEAVPAYEAISYAWGEPVLSHSIKEIASGHAICITTSLSEALRAVRFRSKSRLLWADAVCINQAADEERNHQVALMKRIYKTASQVLVWLGMPRAGSVKSVIEIAVSTIRQFPKIQFSMHTYPERKNWDNRWNVPLRKVLDVDLLSLPWFSRVWVVPEFVLAQRVQFFVGDAEISYWDFFSVGCGLANYVGVIMSSKIHSEIEICRALTSRLAGLFALYDYRESPLRSYVREHWASLPDRSTFEVRSLLTSMTELAAKRQCSDPRDYLYAVLGLGNDTFGIVPHYDWPCHKVFYDAALHMLRASPLPVLQRSGMIPGRDNRLPSFVPDLANLRSPHIPLHSIYAPDEDRQIYAELLGTDSLSINGANIDCIIWKDDPGVLEHTNSDYISIPSEFFTHFEKNVACRESDILRGLDFAKVSEQPLAECKDSPDPAWRYVA